MKDKIAQWYKQGLWNIDMVRDAVMKKIINADDFKEITGKEYK
jgi:hypothetical protein